jgi:glycerol-3-phosphate O-acyltransferase
MARVAATVPVLPVPVVAEILMAHPGGMTSAALDQAFAARMAGVPPPHLTEGDAPRVLSAEDGLSVLRRRGLVEVADGQVRVPKSAHALLRYYANPLPGSAGSRAPALIESNFRAT